VAVTAGQVIEHDGIELRLAFNFLGDDEDEGLKSMQAANDAVAVRDGIARWNRDFDAIRARDPLRMGGLVSPRLRVLPSWGEFMHRAFGAAFVLLSRIYVDRRVLDAPAEVREYLLLHEWGHVVRRHNQVAMVSACVLPFVFFPQAFVLMHHNPGPELAPIAALGLFCTCLQAVLSMWMMSDTRELEADAYAASVIGPSAVLYGIGWVAHWSHQGWTAGRRKRRAALWHQVQVAGEHNGQLPGAPPWSS